MKKTLKITAIISCSLCVLLIGTLVAGRSAFRKLSDNKIKSDRIALLHQSAYAADTTSYLFTYTPNESRAKEIREYFQLDTLLNSRATTWENTLSIAAFVARNIPHANQTIQPERRDAISLWEYHKNIEPAFNCRMHAILLHELLLSAGIENRFVTCLPEDGNDNDCHVVNIAWLPEIKKWAMIDSDMQAYITNQEGTPLSLSEMREYLITDKPFTVHPLAAEKKLNVSYYTSYWAKNLYWFVCWENTSYDKEVHYEGRSIYLVPQGFKGFERKAPSVITTDESRFWAAPR